LTQKSQAAECSDISATWLSRGDPIGFPSHPHGWFSIIVYCRLSYGPLQHLKRLVSISSMPTYFWILLQHHQFHIT